MNDEDDFIRETDEKPAGLHGDLTGWEAVVFELADDEEPSD
ncbi:MAG TPA: hypothetical protein VF980_02535 [Thermoanaerobaculia bacterium]